MAVVLWQVMLTEIQQIESPIMLLGCQGETTIHVSTHSYDIA